MQPDAKTTKRGESEQESQPRDAMGRDLRGMTEEQVSLGFELSCLHADMVAFEVVLSDSDQFPLEVMLFDMAVQALKQTVSEHGHEIVEAYLRRRAEARYILAEETRKAFEYVRSGKGKSRRQS
jgi:hypothetical protein